MTFIDHKDGDPANSEPANLKPVDAPVHSVWCACVLCTDWRVRHMHPEHPEVDYYHRRVCGCGEEVLHDGRRAGCRECAEQEDVFLCAQCRPYVFADLLKAGKVGPVTLNRIDLTLLGLLAFAAGMAVGWWLTK